MPCPSEALLVQFIEGTLSHEQTSSLEEHLDACASCRQTVSATARRRTAPSAAAGARIGRYVLQAPLGAGAMGVVHAAFDPDLDRRIAVKLLAPHPDGALASRQARLAREARSLARISHPNVVPVHDVGVSEGRLFIAMELVDGDTLRAHVARAALPTRDKLALLVQAGHGLAAAHAAGVVHRDFKPDNVFVGRDGRVRVGDFGLAAPGSGEADSDGEAAVADARVTHSGALLGTPAYMAPEQLRGEPATAASDQFAFAVTAWEILFGARPFTGATPLLLAGATRRPPADPPGGDRALAGVLRRALAPDPGQRYPDVTALLAALQRAARPRRTGRLVGAGALAAVGALSLGLVLRGGGAGGAEDPCATTGAELRAVWQPAARVGLLAGFQRSGAPAGVELGMSAARALDELTAGWSTEAVGACTERRHALITADAYAARAQCLRARTDELAALLAVFARADLATIEHAAAAIAALGTADDCRTARAAVAVPAARRADVDRARARLAEALALRRTGHYRDALAALAAIPADLPDLGLRARIETQRGVLATALGDLAAARDALSRAAALADEARDDRLRAHALIETLALVGDEAVALPEAARIEEQARAAVERTGDANLRVALAAAVGDVEMQRGRFADAIRAYDTAIAGFRARRPPEPINLADVLNSAAGAHTRIEDHAGALRLFDEALAIATEAVGAVHPLVAAIEGSRVESLEATGRHADAIASAQRAIAIYQHVFGDRHVKLAAAIDNLAILRTMDGDHAAALALFERSLAITTAALGPDHAELGTSWLNIASTHKAAGHLDAAAAAYAHAIAIWERALGPSHVDLARPLVGLADVELRRKAADRAVPLLERALAIREATEANPDHLAHTRWLLAQALAALHRDPRRVSLLATQARDHYAATDDPEDAAEITAWLAHH